MIEKICEHTFIKNLDSNSVVLDLGANTGVFSRTISEKLGCKVYSIEPVPTLFDSIQETDLIKKMAVAVASKSGFADVYLPEDRCATMHKRKQDEAGKMIRVEAVSLNEIVKKLKLREIDLIKMDIEGEELPILESLNFQDLQIADQWTIEFHDFLYPETHERVEKIKRKFIYAGFFGIPFSITNNGDVLFIKNNKISILEYFYLKYILRYLLGLNRRLNKLLNDY